MTFPVTIEVINLEDIFHSFFYGIGISIHYKKVLTTISLAPLVLRISLMVLVLLASLALVGEKLPMLITKYVSGRNINRFGFSEVLLLFFVVLFPQDTSN